MINVKILKRIAKRCAALAAAVLIGVSILSVGAVSSGESKKTVRVGYMDYDGFIEPQEDGSCDGYGAEYLQQIADYTGYSYEYEYGQWTELLEKLRNKEIDFLCTAQYTEDRASQFDYSAYPIGYTQGLLYTKKESHLCYEDFSMFDGMTVGTLKGSAMTGLFAKYAESNGFSFNLSEFDTENELINALNNGTVDSICSESLANHTNLSLLANFGADAYYVISYKGNDFMSDVNYALQEIKTDVDFEANLYHKYYDSSAAESSIQFTSDERNYINSADIVTVGFMSDRSPLSYADENGNPTGMLVDIMNTISEKTGLKFSYTFLPVGQTGYDFLTNGGGELVAGVASSAFSSPNPQLLQTETLQSDSVVFVGREGISFSTSSSLTVAIPNGFINGEKVVSAEYPNFTYYHGTSNADCLKAIRDGKADVMIQNMYIIRECLQSPLYEGIEMFPAYTFPESEKAVALPGNELLVSIINKAIRSFSDEQANNIVINNTVVKGYHAAIGEIIYKYRFPLIGITVLLVAVIVMILSLMFFRQRSYHEMEKVNKKLEKSNCQLEDAVKQADRANTAKSLFLSRMSHEIRTPMNAIVGLTEIAKQHEHNADKIDNYLNKIETSSKVLLNIINDVLDMSAIESNKLKIADEKFDIKQILTEITTIYYPQCEQKGISFEMSTDLENEIFSGDSLRINQVLFNLISNAYKFTEKGGRIAVSVKETARKENTAFIRFTVSDTGAGMSKDMMERLFKPFEQETANTAQKHGGSGLGLSIAKNLVDLMHGAIAVKSEKGSGTEFTVDLPLAVLPQRNLINAQQLKSVRILVVDDDATSLDYASIVLKRIGAKFETATSGIQAIQMIDDAEASGDAYRVVMVDWKMPDMNGIELTRKIREREKEKTLIIIISAYDLNQVEDEAKAAGADHFVSKPLFQSTVFDVLMTLSGKNPDIKSDLPQNYDFSGKKILLAEDNELNSEIAVELLEMVNLEVDHAENGRRAVQLFEDAPAGTYDAILMDIQMPQMDGYEATKAIRSLERDDAKIIPIYAMTANAFTEDVSMALSAGMNGHIAKPIDTATLYQTLYNEFNG